jgi:ribonuclease BN (tRNA processing enzyme)
MGRVRVTFLGTADAFSASGNHQAGYLVQNGATSLLLDCGPGTLQSMKQLGIDPLAIDLIALSHLHGDHFAGLPFLFLQYKYESLRKHPLRIAGPPGTTERVWALFRASYRGLAADPLPFSVLFTEMTPDVPVDFGPVVISPFQVPHQQDEICLGLRVGIDGRLIVYSGDTGWTEDLVTASAGADLFICECCYFETRLPIHLDYPRLAENRHRFDVRRIVLTHLGREVLARRDQLDMELAHDGLVIEV